MKQNLPPAKDRPSLTALVTLAAVFFSASACVTRPSPPQSLVQLNSDAPTAERRSLININSASRQELEKLPGVGSGIAERIIAHRQQYGPFRRAEHLMMVRGISDRKFRELRAMIVVE
ncbi:MAG: helix-hairpin-helix domain-containing protein [Acidobacteriota bacterium]